MCSSNNDIFRFRFSFRRIKFAGETTRDLVAGSLSNQQPTPQSLTPGTARTAIQLITTPPQTRRQQKRGSDQIKSRTPVIIAVHDSKHRGITRKNTGTCSRNAAADRAAFTVGHRRSPHEKRRMPFPAVHTHQYANLTKNARKTWGISESRRPQNPPDS